MNIEITKHAVKRYRERLFDYKSSGQQIKNILAEVALKGKQIRVRLSSVGLCAELRYKGMYIVIIKSETGIVVLTCLGNESYRKWVKHQDPFFIKGSIRHSDAS